MVRFKLSQLTGLRAADYWRHAFVVFWVAATYLAVFFLMTQPGPAFNYRLGQVVDREIALRVKISIANETKTRNAREEAAAKSPLVFLQNPEPIVEVRRQFDDLTEAVASSAELMSVPETLRARWRLTTDSFASLKTLLPDKAAAVSFNAKLDKAFAPLLEYGILDPKTIPPNEQRRYEQIEIHGAFDETVRFARRDVVELSAVASPDGILQKKLQDAFGRTTEAATLFSLIVDRLRPTLTFDALETRKVEDNARGTVYPAMEVYLPGLRVVPAGSTIDADQLALLREEARVWNETRPPKQRAAYAVGMAVLSAAVFLLVGLYIRTFEPKLTADGRRLAALCITTVVALAAAHWFRIDTFSLEILPVVVVSHLMVVAFGRPVALVATFALSLLAAVLRGLDVYDFTVLLVTASVGVLVLDGIRSRTKLIYLGGLQAVVAVVLTVGLGMLTSQTWTFLWTDASWRAGGALLAGFLTSGLLPFLEAGFGIVTEISLIELSDTSHPLLKELVHRAPGTYNHSVTVSIVSEAACKAIGANALLVRVGALFHDVGKMLKPQYFVENVGRDAPSRHAQLAPAMSTLVIIGHVKDGADLALRHSLPQPIIDLIEQHHGTTVVEYFLNRATVENREAANPEETVDESRFRYPGPKPQSREAAVLMLADCVESASRTLSEPTPARIEKLVHTLALNRLLDGQFNESGLTLSELR
ncbi:MAG: HD family phosphohydrolase, partial [Planctomycetia bacterium]